MTPAQEELRRYLARHDPFSVRLAVGDVQMMEKLARLYTASEKYQGLVPAVSRSIVARMAVKRGLEVLIKEYEDEARAALEARRAREASAPSTPKTIGERT